MGSNQFLSSNSPEFKSQLGVPAVAEPRTIGKANGKPYDGRELGPSGNRPGAMDAYQLPSRIGRTLHYPGGSKKEIE